MNDKPDSAAKNKHHTEAHLYKSQEELYDQLLGRGAGDPDMQLHYPNELKAEEKTQSNTSESINQ